MDPIQGHWTALSIPDGCQLLETKDGDDLTDPIHVHWVALGIPEMGKRKQFTLRGQLDISSKIKILLDGRGPHCCHCYSNSWSVCENQKNNVGAVKKVEG